MNSYSAPQEAYYDDEIDLRELVEIIRKRMKLIIVLPLIAALLAFGVTKFVIVPKFEASAKIALGTFSHDIYSNVATSREVLVSRDFLFQVYQELGLDDVYTSVEDLVKKVSVENVANTRMLSIKYQDTDPQRAQKVVNSIVVRFMGLSNEAYEKAEQLLMQRIAELEAAYEDAKATHDNLLSTLASLEALQVEDAEIALARARIVDYLPRVESLLMSLSGELHDAQLKLSTLENVRIIEEPFVGLNPVNIRPMFNTAIALVLGGMVALGLVFILEYFEKNPLKS